VIFGLDHLRSFFLWHLEFGIWHLLAPGHLGLDLVFVFEGEKSLDEVLIGGLKRLEFGNAMHLYRIPPNEPWYLGYLIITSFQSCLTHTSCLDESVPFSSYEPRFHLRLGIQLLFCDRNLLVITGIR
jgi:hypothetical protein